jgi:hypothetical protein
MPDSNFSCVVRISDTYTDQSLGQVEREVWAVLRYTGHDGDRDPEVSLSGTYVGIVGQARVRQGKVSGDLPETWGAEVLDELYRQAMDNSPNSTEFVAGASIHFDVEQTFELLEICQALEVELSGEK